MNKSLFALFLTAAPLSVLAEVASAPQCPFTADYLATQLGQPFDAGTPEQGILGKACSYQANGIKLLIDAGPNPAPSAEMYRKMSNPPGTGWLAIAGDPDHAVHLEPTADIQPFPLLSYERHGWLVNITVLGIHDKTAIDAWNAKLVQLKRIP